MSDEKPQKPGKPKEVKGERQKAKGSQRQKAENIKPKAVSTRKPAARQKNKAETRETPAAFTEIKPVKSEIENPKSETPMEVHHHPQLDHKPKPIKEYLLEGLMIFIAVMMGFIAENVREDITNHEHAHQLVEQLVRDLKADTSSLNYAYEGESRILVSNNTLFSLLQQPLATVDTKKLLKMATNSDSMFPFHATGGAIGAIKAELHLKQFSNSKIISFFGDYEARIDLLHTIQNITLQYQHNYLEPFLTEHFSPASIDASINGGEIPDPQVRNLTQSDFTQLATRMVFIKINTNELLDYNRKLKKDATKLLQYVQAQFDVE